MARRKPGPLASKAPAGYSGTPLPRKLGIKEGMSVALLSAPDDFESILKPLPDDVTIRRTVRSSCPLVLCFVRSRGELDKILPRAKGLMAERTGLWVCWPKKASGVVTDLDENVVRAAGLASGLVDFKVAAIDHTWSGLKFAVRASGG